MSGICARCCCQPAPSYTRFRLRGLNCTLHFIKANPFKTFIILHSPGCLPCLVFYGIRCNRFSSQFQLLVLLASENLHFGGSFDTVLVVARRRKICAFLERSSFLCDSTMHVGIEFSAILHNLRKGCGG